MKAAKDSSLNSVMNYRSPRVKNTEKLKIINNSREILKYNLQSEL